MFTRTTPEMEKLAKDWVVAGLARDLDFIEKNSYTPDEAAVHTFASGPDNNYSLAELISHLDGIPPRFNLDSQPTGFSVGDVAWLYDTPKMDMLHDGIIDSRITVVLVRVDGTWKVAHAHLSEGVPHTL